VSRKPKVLLAEDEEMHSFPIEVALRRVGLLVTTVTNASDAISKGVDMDALVIDARLPSEALEGLHAAAQLIKSGFPPSNPLVFISVYSEENQNVQQKMKQYPELKNRYVWLEKFFEPNNLIRILHREWARGRASGSADAH
jgi:CheY-like chemotaxis protein